MFKIVQYLKPRSKFHKHRLLPCMTTKFHIRKQHCKRQGLDHGPAQKLGASGPALRQDHCRCTDTFVYMRKLCSHPGEFAERLLSSTRDSCEAR